MISSTKHTVGANLVGGTTTVLVTSPVGYNCIVTMLFIGNAGTNSKSVSATWNNTVDVTFQGAKNVGAGDSLEFGGLSGYFVVLKQGESLSVTTEANSSFSTLVSFELVRTTPSPVSF